MNPTYYLGELLRYIKSAKVSVITTTIVICIAVLLLGVYVTISINSILLLRMIRDKVEIDAYLDESFNEKNTNVLINNIKTIGGIRSVTFISKEDAAKIFAEDFGEDVLTVFDYNPLPASVKITLYDEYKTIDRIEKIKNELISFREIDEVVYAQNNLNILERNSNSLVFLNLSLLIVITFSSIFLISNTIRLMINAKSKTIEVMKLIGATNETIRTPFILQGILQGIAGSIIAIIILQLFLGYFYSAYTNSDFKFSIIDTTFLALMVLFGVLLGAFGSYISIRKFLKLY